MHFLVFVQISSSNISVNRDCVVLEILRLVLNHVESVRNHVRMVDSPAERLDLLNCDEPSQVVNLSLGVHSISLLSREIE